MKYVSAIAGISFLVCIAGQNPVFAKDAPTSAPQLLQELNAGLKAKDKDAILALFNWEGVAASTQGFYSSAVSDLLERGVNGVKLAPLPKGFRVAWDHNGFRFSANVSTLGLVDVALLNGEILPYGKKGNAFYLAGLSREKIPANNSPPASDQRLAINVQDEAGKPMSNVVVICADADTLPMLVKTSLSGGRESFQTDSQGRFTMRLITPNLFLVAANDQGFGWLPNLELTNEAVLVMQPWARIEGFWTNRNHAARDEHLRLELDVDHYREYVLAPMRYWSNEVSTDAQGRFVFEYVPPSKLFINRQDKQGHYWSYFGSLEAKPGETSQLAINTRGRTVLGRVKVGAGLVSSLDLSSCSGALLTDIKGREGSRRNAFFPVAADGSFHADRVEPGNYTISGEIRQDNKLVASLEQISVCVPDDASEASDVPFDIGIVTLKPALNPGDAAPAFSTRTLDDKPLNLSDYRGKYVLLDFWATWCEPCVAETPNMKATYEAFGNTGRFAMISLSLDSEAAGPKKFVRNQGIAWTQGFLGDWSKDKVTKSYGINGIPAILLIGPDGKIMAANLRGPKIKEAVAAALAR